MNEFLGIILRIIGLERRRDDRLSLGHTVECKCTYVKADKSKEFSAAVVNISKGGILLMTHEEKVYPKTVLNIRFELSSDKEPILIHGSVLRTYREEGQDWYHSAVKFSDNKEGARLLVDTFLADGKPIIRKSHKNKI